MTEQPALRAASATGAIYDLGYRGYDGPRLGRRYAVATLFWASLRARLRTEAQRPGQDRADGAWPR